MAGSSMAHELLCYSDPFIELRKGEQAATFTLAPSSPIAPQYHLLPKLRLSSGLLPLDLALEISGKKRCPVFQPCSWCGGSVSSCPWESVPHVGLKAGSWPRKGRGIPDNQKNLGRGSGITVSTHPVTALSTHPSSGWVPKRVLGAPPYCSPNRIPQNQSLQGYWQHPRPGSCLR